MIKTFRHKGLKELYETGDSAKVLPAIKTKIKNRLYLLDNTETLNDLKTMDGSLHELKGNQKGVWAIKATANFRLTFTFEDKNVYDLDLEDYH